jgi:hypothetical protein
LAAGEAAGDAAGLVAGEAAGPALAGGGAFSSPEGARFPMFDKSGPILVLPIKTGRSKM